MLAFLALLVGNALAAPPVFTHQGRLSDVLGQPIDGSVQLDFYLYNAVDAADGAHVWTQQITTPVSAGYYSVQLGNADLEEVLDNEALWMEVRVNNEPLSGRQRLGSVPFAARAANTDGGAPASALASCQAILTDDATAASGTYWIDPDDTGPYQVWCEMSIASGGWELAMNLDTGDGQVRGWSDRMFWEGGASTGEVANPFDADFKSSKVFSTAHQDLLIVVHRAGTPVGWRAWDLEHDRSLRQFLNTEPSRNPIRLATNVLAADVGGIEATEVVVRPAGALDVNEVWGNTTSFDVARVRSSTLSTADNTQWGLGFVMDAQNHGGSVSHPMGGEHLVCDAGSSLPWSQYVCIGTDRDCVSCGEQVGGTRGLAYDYAIYVRNPVPSSAPTPTSLGGSQATAADDCQAIKAADASAPSGTYWVDFGGSTATEAVCDMTTAGGGWTLMINLDTSDGTPRYYRDDAFWTGTGGYGTPSGALTGDYKDAGAFTRSGAFSDILITAHQEGLTINGYRAWNLSGTSSFETRFASPSSRSPTQLTVSSITDEISTLWSAEAIIRPNNNLFVNRVWGAASFDVARIHNIGIGTTDNRDWGIGMQMDAQNNGGTESSPGLPRYPGCDAGADVAWTAHFCMGSDVDADNGLFGATIGNGFDINYDYAIWVR